MKYMKLGTKPDTFYTEEATRTVLSDVPTDIVIQIKSTKYLLHKFPLLLKCGLLQQLSSSASTTASSPIIILHDFPSDENSFELCAKFCYNISITISATTFPSIFTSATFLQMTASVSSPNLLPILHSFLVSSILPSWKYSISALASSHPKKTSNILVRQLVDSVISKILIETSRVNWSFTYSRPYRSVPKDWWTEDVADLPFLHFHTVISAVRTLLPQALVGEALHVFVVKNLPDPDQGDQSTPSKDSRKVLEAIVSMIPNEREAVSGNFLLRLLKTALSVDAAPSVMAELITRSGRQLDEVTSLESFSRRNEFGIVEAVVEKFFETGRREGIGKVAKTFDEYIWGRAREEEMEVEEFLRLVKVMPDFARKDHDGLYRAIDAFLQGHPDLSKADKKKVCQLIDCRKISAKTRSLAIANDRLPLRILVQLLFIEQEKEKMKEKVKKDDGREHPTKPFEKDERLRHEKGEGSKSKPTTKWKEEKRKHT